MGVTKENGKYRARYTFRGVRYNVGSYDTKMDAELALARHQWENSRIPQFEWQQVKSNHRYYTVLKPSLYQRVKNWLKRKQS